MKFSISALLATMLFLAPQILNAQCGDCSVDLPMLPADTVFLQDAPDGEQGKSYEEQLSFRMPKTTDPVHDLDPSIPPGLTLDKVKILALGNLPPGLTYKLSQTTFDPANETDGCVTLCGTPLQPGHYEILIILEATIFVATQTASYPVDIYIAPAASMTDGFSMSNTTGCGEVTVEFTNNVPSNGDAGFSYIWDFGNGFTSTLENPGIQVYDEPGTYFINYEAAIDTITPTLTAVNLLSVDCDDLIGDPDVFIRIKDPSGQTVFSTSPVNNTPIPISIPVNIPLESGTYKLEVRDDDPFGDANCGDLWFNFATSDTLVDGGLTVTFDIFKPVFNVSSTDTVVVLALPDQPELNMSGNILVCSNELLDLEVLNYAENIQWYHDNDAGLLLGDTFPTLTVSLPGDYWVEYTDENGCVVTSEIASVEEIPAPAVPTFHNDSNVLTLSNPDELPANYSAQWYWEGNLIVGETGITMMIWESGEYTLEIIDEDTGCKTAFTFGAVFDPTLPTEEEELLQSQVLIFPNPTTGEFRVSMQFDEAADVGFEVFDLTGKIIFTEPVRRVSDYSEKQFDISNLAQGTYYLRLIIGNSRGDAHVVTKRVVKM